MLIEDVLYNAELRFNKAKAAHLNGNDCKATEHLGILYDYLDDHVGSKAIDKFEPDESCDGI